MRVVIKVIFYFQLQVENEFEMKVLGLEIFVDGISDHPIKTII